MDGNYEFDSCDHLENLERDVGSLQYLNWPTIPRYTAQIQNNTNILNLQIIYRLRANFPGSIQQVLVPTFEEHCFQAQQEVTELIYVLWHFSKLVDNHQDDIWLNIKDYWINVNQSDK